MASEKIEQTERQESERKQAALNLIKEIMTKFKIADVNVATDLAAFTFGKSGGSVSAKALTPTTPASVSPKFKLYKLHVGDLDEAYLTNWANEVSITRPGKEIRNNHPHLKISNKAWKSMTNAKLSDFLASIVGQDRSSTANWVECVKNDFNLRVLKNEHFDRLIYEAMHVMPAEYQLHLTHYSNSEKFSYRFQMIIYRVAWTFPCPVNFKLVPNALVGRYTLACRHWGELEAPSQIRVFRALSEYFLFGLNFAFLSSLYGLSPHEFRTVVAWFEGNLTVKEAGVYGWICKSTTVPLPAPPHTLLGPKAFELRYLPAFWEVDPRDFAYLTEICNAWEKIHVGEDSPFYNTTADFRRDFFYLVLTSTHLVEDAVKVHANFTSASEMEPYLTAFKDLSSSAVATMVEERSSVYDVPYRIHYVSEECLLAAQNWEAIKSVCTWPDCIRETFAQCESIVSNPDACDDSACTYCNTKNAPLRVKLLQLFLDATDTNVNLTELEAKYKCAREPLAAVLKLIKALFPDASAAESNKVNFDLDRPGSECEAISLESEADDDGVPTEEGNFDGKEDSDEDVDPVVDASADDDGDDNDDEDDEDGIDDHDDDDDEDDNDDDDDSAEGSGSSGESGEEQMEAESSEEGSAGGGNGDSANAEVSGTGDQNSAVSETGEEKSNQSDRSAVETASNYAINGDASANQSNRETADDLPQVSNVVASLVRIEPEAATSKPATAEAESPNGAVAATEVDEQPPAKKTRHAKGIPETGARVVRLK